MFKHSLVKTRAPIPEASRSSVRSASEAAHEVAGTRDAGTAPAPGNDFSRIPVFTPNTPPSVRPPSASSIVSVPRIQAKLRVSTPDQPGETEADRMAEKVVARDDEPVEFVNPDRNPTVEPGTGALAGGDQTAGWWDQVHRAAVDTQPLQSAAPRNQAGSGLHADPRKDPLKHRLETRLGRGAELPTDTRAQMERSFHADFASVRVHTDADAAAMSQDLRAHAFTYGRDIFFADGQYNPVSQRGKRLLAHELTHVLQQGHAAGDRLDRQAQGTGKVGLTLNVTVDVPVSGPEFLTRAVMQYLETGHDEAAQKIKSGKFTCSHEACRSGVGPERVGKPIAVLIVGRGMSASEKTAAGKRTAAIGALPASQRKELNDEVDRRFWSKFDYKRGQPLGRGATEEGMRQAWLRTREDLLGDQERVAKLAPRIQNFLTVDGKRRIAPGEYRTALRLAKKLESFSDEEWQLYKRRINASTDDYEVMERSIDTFKAQQAGEKNVRDRIAGKEGLYQQVKAFKAMDKQMHKPVGRGNILPINLPGNRERFEAARGSLDAALKAAGFASIAEFDAANQDFLHLFRKRAVEITLLVLRASERAVAGERKRYEDRKNVDDLFAQLAPMRAALTESYKAGRESMPTPMQLKTDSLNTTPAQKAALSRSIASAQRAGAERAALSAQHPMLKDPKLSSEAMNVDSAAELGVVLRKNADERQESIVRTRVSVLNDNDKIFKLDRIVELTRQELSVGPKSIYDLVIEDYRSELESDALWTGLAIGALAIGLGLISFGTGTVAVLAGAGALALGVYQAGEEYDKYEEGQAAAHTNFDMAMSVSSDEPSAIWVAVALIGVGLDGVALASAFKAALPAARLLKEAGGAARFEAELAKATELSEALQKALVRAEKSQSQYLQALDELAEARATAKFRLHSGPDSEVVNKMVKTAYYAIKNKITDFEVFMRQLKLQKLAKGIDLSTLTAEEEAAWRAAFETAKGQAAADAAKFSVKVPYKAGAKVVTFDEAGKMLLDGKKISGQDYKEIYKNLDLSHVIAGHGPQKPLIEVMNEAKNSKTGLSARFASDERLLQAVARAKAESQATGRLEIFLDALPNEGRAFAKTSAVPRGAQTMLPFDAPPGVVEIQVKRIHAVFRPDGSLITIFLTGF